MAAKHARRRWKPLHVLYVALCLVILLEAGYLGANAADGTQSAQLCVQFPPESIPDRTVYVNDSPHRVHAAAGAAAVRGRAPDDTAFDRGILAARTLPRALAVYRDPTYDRGPRDRMWHMFNVLNLPMQPRSQTNPQAFALQTMQLMALLGREPGYDAPPPPDIVLEETPDGSFAMDDADVTVPLSDMFPPIENDDWSEIID